MRRWKSVCCFFYQMSTRWKCYEYNRIYFVTFFLTLKVVKEKDVFLRKLQSGGWAVGVSGMVRLFNLMRWRIRFLVVGFTGLKNIVASRGRICGYRDYYNWDDNHLFCTSILFNSKELRVCFRFPMTFRLEFGEYIKRSREKVGQYL